MKSHTYEFTVRDLFALLVPPLGVVGLFAVLLHLSAAFHLLPPPRPTLDLGRTVLLHQAAASQSAQDANLLLLGDSSCLMNVAARPLGVWLPGVTALNLGTDNHLDPVSYATLLRHYTATNRAPLRAVVLLMHPEALRRAATEPGHTEMLTRFFDQADHSHGDGVYPRLAEWLGLDILKGRVLSRVVPAPLHQEFGMAYGFTSDLWQYLTANQGSAIDPRQFTGEPGQGNTEYRLSEHIKSAGQTFKSAMPAGVKLIAGITPVPESLAPRGYPERYQQWLRDWSLFLQADALLTNLPPTLPDHQFASKAHLNESGVRAYTIFLARELELLVR